MEPDTTTPPTEDAYTIDVKPQTVRRHLATLRQHWDKHAPASPLCLAEELEPGLSVADFCVRFLLSQRSRRHNGAGGCLNEVE